MIYREILVSLGENIEKRVINEIIQNTDKNLRSNMFNQNPQFKVPSCIISEEFANGQSDKVTE